MERGSAGAAPGQCDLLLGCPVVRSLGALSHDSFCLLALVPDGRARPLQCGRGPYSTLLRGAPLKPSCARRHP